jgi:serine/threonine-protein kinase
MSFPHRGSRLGTRFGPYELKSLVGVCGMGEVYRAYDTVKGRTVAVKVLRSEMAADPVFQERFRRESRVAARLQEPHVVPVHDFGDIDGVLYIDMRLVEGANLKDVLRADGPLAPRRAASIITQVAAALDAAHADGLVHRDIKPENVLLTPDDFAYLADFGIAHAGGDASVTMTGSVIGSSAYMAAERFSGGQVGPPADVYSLTCLLHECLTGRPPFEATDLAQLMGAHVFAPPPRPSIMRRGIGRAFDDVIARGMAKDPEARFHSAGELARAATAAAVSAPQESTAVSVTPGHPSPTRQFPTVHPNPAATGHLPYPPPVRAPEPVRTPEPPRRRRKFGTAQVVLIAVTILTFAAAAVLAAVLVVGNNGDLATNSGGGAPPPTRLAAPPPTSTPTTTSAAPTTAPSGPAADAQGFVGHAARCDSGDSPAVMIRTASSLAVVCQTGQGTFYYHGERLADGANLRIADAVASSGGFVAVNPADGARYEVRPDRLTIVSNGHVDSSEPALPFATS